MVSQPLRVVLLMRSPLAPAWIVELANALSSTDVFDVRALVAPDDSLTAHVHESRPKRSWAWVAEPYRTLERGSDRLAEDPFELVDVTRVLPALRLGVLSSGPPEILRAPIDVAVAADSTLAREHGVSQGLCARLGIWYSPELRRPEGSDGTQAVVETAAPGGHAWPQVRIYSVCRGSGAERLVKAADARLESLLAIRNRRAAAWAAASLVLAALEQVAGEGRKASEARTMSSPAQVQRPDDELASASPPPFARSRGALSGATCVAARVLKKAVFRQQWILGYQFGKGSQLAPTEMTRFVVPPADRFWADPHVLHVDGEYHLFFEDFSYRTGKAHISTLRMGDDGPIGESRVALQGDHHLSYPFVFHFGGEWFMIPESSQADRIDIYRAQELPARWKHFRTLMNRVRAVDTIVVEHDGRWWLFTTIQRLRGCSSMSHLYLFSADNPLSETWEPHPSNPIASGAAGARAAGSIMRRGDRLIRPAQDSRLSYGRQVHLNEITVMTRDDFQERPVGCLEPNARRGFIGLHTVSQAGDLTVVDLCRWRTRL